MSPSVDRQQNTRDFSSRGDESRKSRQHDNLALMFQGVITGIVRLQASRITRNNGQRSASQDFLNDPTKFRERMLTALRDITKQAKAAGYSPEDIQEAEFATIAFLDEVVLSLGVGNPSVAEWKRQTLAVEMYGEARAGEVFFDRIDSLMKSRRDSPHVADVLEVYLLCLLLGFEGRYGDARGELNSISDHIRRRIDSIYQRDLRLAPDLAVAPKPVVAPGSAPRPQQWLQRWAFVWILLAAVAVFFALKLNLVWAAQRVIDATRI